MSDVTVAQFAEVLKVPVDRLLVQLESAGIQVAGPQALISDEAKLELLTHLRRAHGATEPGKCVGVAAPRKITLARKTQSELKQASTQGLPNARWAVYAGLTELVGDQSRPHAKRESEAARRPA